MLILTLLHSFHVCTVEGLERRVDSMKFPSAGDVISGIELTIGLLKSILDTLGNIKRKVAIGVENHTGKTWTASSQSIYFDSGTSDNVLPYKVVDTKALLQGCRKTSGPVARGTVGVFTYTLSDGNTIAVMWSVPFDYNLYSNWWNVLAFRGKKYANKELFDYMYSWSGNPFSGDNEWKTKNLDLGYKVRGAMAASGMATMEIHVEKQ